MIKLLIKNILKYMLIVIVVISIAVLVAVTWAFCINNFGIVGFFAYPIVVAGVSSGIYFTYKELKE